MTTSNAAIDKTAASPAPDKAHEKLAEKRRALGRGLESLLPGPRVVATIAPTLPQSARKDGAPSESVTSPSSEISSLAAPPQAGMVEELHAVAAAPMPDGDHVVLLNLDQIVENPYQTRTEFDIKELTNLAGSIQTQGVLQPIVVRPARSLPGKTLPLPEALASKEYFEKIYQAPPEPDEATVTGPEIPDRYVLILGERRFRASKIAGNTTIPALVKRVSPQQAAEMTLVENLQRQDLDCLDQAAAFRNLSKVFNLTQEEIGNRVGVSREQVSNYLRLLNLPQEVQVALRQKVLTYSHARLLLALPEDQIVKVARVAIDKKMSVALLTEMVMDVNAPELRPERKPSGARWVDPNVRAEQRQIEAALGMRVRIQDRQGKGKITIEYATLEDFDQIVTRLKKN
ncbi:MAG: ParB/RepB/Spo0J family partition protein [Terriglobales bacterium]|jgi:ParB family chromosome partitioning protein